MYCLAAAGAADGTTFTHFGKDAGVKDTEAWDLFEDSRGNIWLGGHRGSSAATATGSSP